MRHPNMNMDKYSTYEDYRLALDEWNESPWSAAKINANAAYKTEIERQQKEYQDMTENNIKQFATGVKITKKESQYGSFYKVGININEFCDKNPMNERGWVNFTIFESKEGKPYAVIDTYGTDNNNIVKIAEVNDDEISF